MAKKKSKASRKGKRARSSPRKKQSLRRAVRSKSISDKPGWMGIEGVHLLFTTKDPHAINSFYRDTLGFPMAVEKRRRATHKPGFSYMDESRGLLSLQSTKDTSMGFQDYNLAYHWVAQLGGRPPEEPLSAQIYLIVRDVDRIYDHLLKKGVQFFSPPRDMPWGHRIAECADPEGRRVVFAELLKKRR